MGFRFGATSTFGVGNTFGGPITSGKGGWGVHPLVAWGDSLTAGGYPSIAGALFSPARMVANKGLGGQGAYSIAARQGGRPIIVTVAGNTIPIRTADTVLSWTFETNSGGWVGHGAVRSGGKLYCSPAASPAGLSCAIGQTLPNGRMFTLEFDIEIPDGMTVRASGLNSGVFAANNGTGTNGFNMTASGHYKVTLYVGNAGGSPATMNTVCFLMTAGTAGTFSIDNVVLTVPSVSSDYALAVTAKNTNILTSGGAFTGTSIGTLAGVHGIMSTDSSGNWTFTRDAVGGAVDCPAGSTFVPDDTATYRDYTAWIWAGNNAVVTSSDAAGCKSDIAAMINHLAHKRFLVLSALTSSAQDAARIAVLQQMNTDLAMSYGRRFVDVHGALRAAGDGSANDNADIAAGYTPRSLRSDAIHLNAAGYNIVAQEVFKRMREFGG